MHKKTGGKLPPVGSTRLFCVLVGLFRPSLRPGLRQSLGAAFALGVGQGLGDAPCEASEGLRGAVHSAAVETCAATIARALARFG